MHGARKRERHSRTSSARSRAVEHRLKLQQAEKWCTDVRGMYDTPSWRGRRGAAARARAARRTRDVAVRPRHGLGLGLGDRGHPGAGGRPGRSQLQLTHAPLRKSVEIRPKLPCIRAKINLRHETAAWHHRLIRGHTEHTTSSSRKSHNMSVREFRPLFSWVSCSVWRWVPIARSRSIRPARRRRRLRARCSRANEQKSFSFVPTACTSFSGAHRTLLARLLWRR